MAYRDIVFIDHEETTDDEGNLICDEALRLLHHKTDDSVVWECPTGESVQAALDYLLQWDYEPDGRPASDQSQAGSADWQETVQRDGRTFVITYNVGLSYIGLEEII